MSLENWVKNNWLERRDSDAAEIARLLALADGRLKDYRRAVAGKLSADVQLFLAYDAIRISATAALRAAGYRVVRGGSEHYRTIEALEFSIDPQKKLIPQLDTLRRKRNLGSYDDYGLVSQGEAITVAKWLCAFGKKPRIGFVHSTPTNSSKSAPNQKVLKSSARADQFSVFARSKISPRASGK